MREFTCKTSPGRCVHRRHISARGFSLLEAVIAMVILAMTFTTIASAIGAGSGSARETRNQVMATLAAEELLAELLHQRWDQLPGWNGYREEPGDSRAPDGQIEKDRAELLRVVEVMDETRHLEPIDIDIDGRLIRIHVEDRTSRTIMTLERFIPRPLESNE
jgi:Tfp pilus assembly protein PilE